MLRETGECEEILQDFYSRYQAAKMFPEKSRRIINCQDNQLVYEFETKFKECIFRYI